MHVNDYAEKRSRHPEKDLEQGSGTLFKNERKGQACHAIARQACPLFKMEQSA